MDDSQNYYYPSRQSRQYNAKMINGRKEFKEKTCDELKNSNQSRENKLQGLSSCECSFKNTRRQEKDLRMTAASDQRLENFHPRKFRKQKSRSPLTCHRMRIQQSPDHPFDQPSQFFALDHSHYLDHGRYLGKGEKLSKKIKDEVIPDYMETINEDGEAMKIHKKRVNNDKGKLKAQRCLDELEDLRNQITQLECEKMTAEKTLKGQKRRNQRISRPCPQRLEQDNSELDDEDEEEENNKIEREIANIALNEPCTRPRHLVKSPETSTSATETSIPEEANERGQRNIHRVIDAAMARENALHTDKNFKQAQGESASSEATGSEQDPEETLRDSSHHENYMTELKNLRWRYLNHIQDELNRLYDLEQFLDTLTCKSTKSGGRSSSEKGRPATRAAGIQ